MDGKVSGLKREISKSKSFNEVHAKKTIARLKAQLKAAYKENRDNT